MNEEVEQLQKSQEELEKRIAGLKADLEYITDPETREAKRAEIADALESIEVARAKIRVIEREGVEAKKQEAIKAYADFEKRINALDKKLEGSDRDSFTALDKLYEVLEKHFATFEVRNNLAKTANLIAQEWGFPMFATGAIKVLGGSFRGNGIPGAVEYASKLYSLHWGLIYDRKAAGGPIKIDRTSYDLISEKGHFKFDPEGNVI